MAENGALSQKMPIAHVVPCAEIRVFLNLWFGKPMVCVRVAFHENYGNHENDENDEDNSDSYKQGFERRNSGNHGNHENDENHGNPGCPNHGFRNTREMGILGLKVPFSGVLGIGSFL